jgi:hypothetical protein
VTTPSFTLAYILGAGHCGSTLLSMLLNGHSRMLALSELRKIDAQIGRTGNDEDPGPLDTLLWQRVRRRYESTSRARFDELHIDHPSWTVFAGWSRERVQAWAEPAVQLLSCIAAESGRDILIDSSKSWQQLYLLRRSGRLRIQVLHAVRDGRAVLHSYHRKYDSFLRGFRQWVKPSAMAPLLRPMFAQSEWLTVHYEELATRPTETLTRVCDFLGTEFEPAMLRFRSHPWFGISGNRMSRSGSEEIRLDEKWRENLPRRERVLFELLGGPLNRFYGYKPFS